MSLLVPSIAPAISARSGGLRPLGACGGSRPRGRGALAGLAAAVAAMAAMAAGCSVPAGECPTEAALAGFCVPGPPASGEDAGWCTRHVGSCDIRESTCQELVWEAVACLREAPELTKPYVRVEPYPSRSGDASGGTGGGGGAAAAIDPVELHWGRTLELLGLKLSAEPAAPDEPRAGEDPGAGGEDPAADPASDDPPVDQTPAPGGPTVASYDRTAGVVVIRDGEEDLDPAAGLWRLSLAYVQAMQDQELDLDNYFDGWIESFDSWLSVNAATFGEAVCYANAITLDAQRLDPRQWDYSAYYDGLIADTRSIAQTSAAPLEESASIFPVAYGGDMITRLYVAEGPAAVKALVASPPLTSAFPMARGAVEVPAEGAPMASRPLYDPVGDWTYLGRDIYGAWGLYVFLLRAGVAEADASAWALEGWRGDRVWIYYREDPVETLALWQLRFSDAERSGEFVALVDGVEAQLGSTWSARQMGTDALLAVGTDASPIASWLNALAPLSTPDAEPPR